LLKKYVVHTLGFLLVAFGVVGVIYAGLGAAPVDAFNYFVYTLSPLSLGTVAILTGVAVAAIAFYFNRDKNMIFSVLIIFLLGVFIDGWKLIYDLLPIDLFDSYFISIPFALMSIVLISFGTSLTITTGLPCSPYERLMLVIDSRIHSIKYAKMIIEGTFLVLAIIIGILTKQLFDQVNIVTIMLTLMNGPLVGIFTNIINLKKEKKGVIVYAA
jgi:uncharacterized membrane protein YczE